MPLKFAANLSTMFTEHASLLDRYQAAKSIGFTAVECQFPYNYTDVELAKVKQEVGVEQVLINSFPGGAGEMGFAAKPHYEGEFRSSLDLTIKYAKALNCPRIHIMAGLRPKMLVDVEMEATYIDNLLYAAEILAKENIIGVIEPIAPAVSELYFLQSFKKAIEYIKKVNHPNIKLLLDIFHLQKITGNLTEHIKEFLPYTGHVQISQVPDRNQIDASGEIDYSYILSLLEKYQYTDWIGLEYKPTGPTTDSLNWLLKSPFWA